MASFEELQALAEVVSKNKVKHIHVIGNPDSAHTKFEQFYDALATGRLQNDEQAAQFFYQTSPDHAAYRKLKDRLQDRLVNTLFFVDVNQPNFNKHNHAYFICCKQVSAIKILIALHARQAAIPLAEETLKLALEFEFAEFIISLARELRMLYGTITEDRKKFEQMNEITKKYTEVINAELEAEEYFADIMRYFVNSKATKLEIKDKVEKYAAEIEKLFQKISSPRFNSYGYLILTLRYEVINDYKNILKICYKALSYLEPIADRIPITNIFSFAIKVLGYQVYLGNFETAKVAAEKCFQFSRQGTYNWFLTCNYIVIAGFHSKNFHEAYLFYDKAASHPNFKKQPPSVREHWFIQAAYFHYFILIKRILPDPDSTLKKFRLSKFLNEVPIYSKDKRGANISILILQILFLLHQKKYNAIIDRAESLKMYTYRYLKQDETLRSNCFLRMLLALPEGSFNKVAVLRKAEKYVQKLKEVPLHLSKQSAEIEIVPYEMLWEFVLESLDEK